MTVSAQIIDYAGTLFDVVGVSKLTDGNSLLILGLESTPERNLDEFGRLDGRFRMYGFEKHAAPRLESLLDFIRNKGFTAALAGPNGYPLKGEFNLKEMAIRAGLGRRGKSTVVLHPKYGSRLRFMGIITDAPLESLVGQDESDSENPVCESCTICIDVCPANVLGPYLMKDATLCLSNVVPRTKDGRSILCDICLDKCPATGHS